jgi:hypothetical protein
MRPGSHAISVTVVWEIGMAKKSEPKDWAEECADSVELEVPESVRVTLKDQLKGVMQERSLKPAELSKLATALLEPPTEADAEEEAA